jgi:hypothetical protein
VRHRSVISTGQPMSPTPVAAPVTIGIGGTAYQATGTGPSQSSDSASGAKAGRLPIGCRQEGSAFPGGHTPPPVDSCERKKKEASNSRKSRLAAANHRFGLSAIHRAGPRFEGTVHGSSAPNTPYCLFRGRPFALTQSSWTPSRRRSRKWMTLRRTRARCRRASFPAGHGRGKSISSPGRYSNSKQDAGGPRLGV